MWMVQDGIWEGILQEIGRLGMLHKARVELSMDLYVTLSMIMFT